MLRKGLYERTDSLMEESVSLLRPPGDTKERSRRLLLELEGQLGADRTQTIREEVIEAFPRKDCG